MALIIASEKAVPVSGLDTYVMKKSVRDSTISGVRCSIPLPLLGMHSARELIHTDDYLHLLHVLGAVLK